MTEEVSQLVVLAEEPSSEATLWALLPRLVGSLEFSIHAFRGKDDLLKQLPARLRGYRQFLPETARILVLVDRDDDDCFKLKSKLDRIAREAGSRPAERAPPGAGFR